MTVSKEHSHIGGALVPNTLVCEVSRLFSRQDDERRLLGRRLKSRRLADLFSLIDAACLYETLYTLPCTLTSDVSGLLLRQELIDHAILRTLDTSDTHSKIAKLIVDNLRNFSQPTGSEFDESGESFAPPTPFEPVAKRRFERFLVLESQDPTSREQMNDWEMQADTIEGAFDAYQLSGGSSSNALYASSYGELAQSLVWSMNYQWSGAYEDCTSILRDMYYICTSEVFSLPYWPQLDRIEFSKKFPTFITGNTRTALYTLLAEGLRTTVSAIEKEFYCGTTFIPPFAA